MEIFQNSSFGNLLMSLFSVYFSSPSLQSFLLLACGWSLSSSHHTITTYLRLSGAVQYKHFSRFYYFFSSPFYKVMDRFWEKVILLSASFIDPNEPIRIRVDDGTRKKNGRHIQGASYYRNGAGSARQEYRSLWGLNWVWASRISRDDSLECMAGSFSVNSGWLEALFEKGDRKRIRGNF